MKTLHFSTIIDAPRERVWQAMLEDQSYREWTAVFGAGSYYRGDWNKGSKILFVGLDPQTGKEAGMVSRIAESIPFEFVSIEHQGIVQDGIEDTTSEEARRWTPAFENYTLKEKDGSTEVLVHADVADDHVAMFNETWPEALRKLKEIAERR